MVLHVVEDVRGRAQTIVPMVVSQAAHRLVPADVRVAAILLAQGHVSRDVQILVIPLVQIHVGVVVV